MDANKKIDPIPESFARLEEAAEFWDTHSVADYWDEMQEVEIEVRIPRRKRVALASDIAEQIDTVAAYEGVSVETLVNLWIAERLLKQPLSSAKTNG